MKATQTPLLKLLDGRSQFIIPIYQRTYSWQTKQCKQLFDDVFRAGSDIDAPSHFLGSIVYFKPHSSPATSVAKSFVIDGQQRLTTVSLILLALIHFLKEHQDISLEDDETWEEIQETYLVNKYKKSDSRFKLLLTRKDKVTFEKLINEIEIDDDDSKRIIDNYEFFTKKLCPENVQTIYYGVKKLIIVDVILEKDEDNPQLIFESLNSTGLKLTQADLIRNYILMGQTSEHQDILYEKYWHPMEQNFGENIDDLDSFIRDYLTMKESSIPNIDLVYETYKTFLKSTDEFKSVEDAIKSLHRYSKFYIHIALLEKPDPDISKELNEITKLKIDTSYPFLLAVYGDFEEGQIANEELVEIISIISSYVFRKAICGISLSNLNKIFAVLYRQIEKENYLESVKAIFLLMDENKRFPSNEEFITKLQDRNVFNFRLSSYLLKSLENWGRKELVDENYTIEHILPQNPEVSDEWKRELGDDWERVKDKYLHTLGNLTLTGCNSEMSDKPFPEKKSTKGGFNDSPLFLNESVREADVWNEKAIQKRAAKLAKRACEIWKRPHLPDDRLELYKKPETVKEQVVYTIENYRHLQGDILELYKNLEKRILNLDASVRVEFKKRYIAFKVQTNFVVVVPQKTKLRLTLNTEFNRIKDSKGICENVTGKGKWGTGGVRVALTNLIDLDYIMGLIEQAFDIQNNE